MHAITTRALAGAVLLLPLCLLSACPEENGDDNGGGGSFSVDAYPAFVNTTPFTFTGSKPEGDAIFVDGLERVAADDGGTWSLAIDLYEGENIYAFEARGDGVSGAETVTITLDTTAPSVVSQVPAPDATGVSLDVVVEVTLSEPPDCTTVSSSIFSIQGVGAAIGCNDGDATISLTPDANLAASSQFTVTLFSDVADAAGNSLASDFIWSFYTGDSVDETPPVPPTADSPAPTSPTMSATMPVGGTKEANASVEYRHQVDSSLVQDWTEIVGKTAETTWSYTFSLQLGQNAFSLRSVDQSSNVSTTTTDFTVQRDANPNQVDPPTVDAVVSPTAVGNQVLTGTKPADTGIFIGTTELAPISAGTSWSALIYLNAGSNQLDIIAKDGSGNESNPVPTTIVYNPPGEVAGAAQLKIEFDLNDLWNYIGDEFGVGPDSNFINNYGIDIWVEGPFTPGEACFYDAPNFQRRHTRFVATVVHGCPGGSNPPPPAACAQWWWEPNYRAPDYVAAMIEYGWWENENFPIPRDEDRRNANGETWQPGFTGDQVNNPELYYPCVPPECPYASPVNSKPKMYQRLTDGMTEATISSGHSPTGGPALGGWTGSRTYTWDIADAEGDAIQQGPYLVHIALQVDRSGPAKAAQYADYLLSDRETCWGDPAFDAEGPHRAHGFVDFGSTDETVYLKEKGHGTVDACNVIRPAGDTNRVRCSCGGSDPWPCPETPNSDGSLMGGPQEFFNPDKFVDPIGDGQSYPVKVSYCPGGCP